MTAGILDPAAKTPQRQQVAKKVHEAAVHKDRRDGRDGAQALAELGVALARARVAILGVSYLENADDTRNTPAAPLAHALLDAGAEVESLSQRVGQLAQRPCQDLPPGMVGKPLGVRLARGAQNQRLEAAFDLAPERGLADTGCACQSDSLPFSAPRRQRSPSSPFLNSWYSSSR